MNRQSLFIMLCDDSWKRAHHALVVAAGAASLGRRVTIFAGGHAVHAFAADWSGLRDVTPDSTLAAKGVAGYGELRDVLRELDCVFWACDAGMKMCGLSVDALMDGASVRGIVSFLEAVGREPVMTI